MNVDLYSIMECFDNIHISYEEICEAECRTSLNSLISEYFYRLFEDTSQWSLFRESERIRDCSKIWRIDNYIQSHISDVKFVSHCRSKWCLHCQKLLQASRLNRFMPLLQEASKTHDLCHVVLTVPNVSGVRLKASVKLLFKSFSRLIRYFCGRAKIRGIDFSQYGFHAAMRSLEVTYGKYGEDDFHPHLHCIFAFKKGLNLEKHIVNDFSFDYGTLKTFYSDFEVFLQKLWRLIVDSERDKIYNYVAMTDSLGQPLSSTHPDYGRFVEKPKKKNKKDGAITLKALNSLKLGYSCKVDFIEDDETTNRNAFIEVFKYACKVTSEKQMLFTYDQFRSLYFALKGAHVMQGYGAWYRLQFDEEDESIDDFWKVFIAYLRQSETPLSQVLDLTQVKEAAKNKSTMFITRRSFHKWLKALPNTERADVDTVLDGVQPYDPCFKDRSFSVVHYGAAYQRYLTARKTSNLFADIREREELAKASSLPLTLSSEQMSFLDSIF